MTLEQALMKIHDFCVRRKVCVSFDADGRIWHGPPTDGKRCLFVKDLASKILEDDQRVCHEDLVTWIRSELTITDGNTFDELLKESEESLAQTTEKTG